MTNLPKFSTALLHPRYWLTWLGIGVLWLVVQLPYPVIYRLGCGLGKLALRFMKRRAKIVHRNLELCFPEMSEQERRKMVVKNFESVGMGLMETGMAWFWPDRLSFPGAGQCTQTQRADQGGRRKDSMAFLHGAPPKLYNKSGDKNTPA